MRKALLPLLFIIALPAQATIIQVDYIGVVGNIQGTGFGFMVGDAITGQMLIDTTKVDFTLQCGPADGVFCEYYGLNLVSENAKPPARDPMDDFIILGDDESGDYFTIRNGTSGLTPTVRSIGWSQLLAYNLITDFIHGSSLEQNFALTRNDMGEFGELSGNMFEGAIDRATTEWLYSNFVRYDLMSLSVKTVPEPGALVLLLIGLIGIALAARHTTSGMPLAA